MTLVQGKKTVLNVIRWGMNSKMGDANRNAMRTNSMNIKLEGALTVVIYLTMQRGAQMIKLFPASWVIIFLKMVYVIVVNKTCFTILTSRNVLIASIKMLLIAMLQTV